MVIVVTSLVSNATARVGEPGLQHHVGTFTKPGSSHNKDATTTTTTLRAHRKEAKKKAVKRAHHGDAASKPKKSKTKGDAKGPKTTKRETDHAMREEELPIANSEPTAPKVHFEKPKFHKEAVGQSTLENGEDPSMKKNRKGEKAHFTRRKEPKEKAERDSGEGKKPKTTPNSPKPHKEEAKKPQVQYKLSESEAVTGMYSVL